MLLCRKKKHVEQLKYMNFMKGGYLKNGEYIMVELFDTFSYELFSKKLVMRIKEKTFNTLVITKLLTGSVSIYTGHISQYLNKWLKNKNKNVCSQ